MAGNGGYQRPTNPAAVSGPGAMSQRTDGRATMDTAQANRYLSGGGAYGASKELNAQEQGAPLASSPEPAFQNAADLDAYVAQMSQASPFNRPSERPDEVISHGANYGAGPGSEALGPIPITPDDTINREALSNIVLTLQANIDNDDVTPATRNLYLRAVALQAGYDEGQIQ